MISPGAAGRPTGWVYADAPVRVYWELTRACDLACRHCRADAIPVPDPAELTPGEGAALVDALAGFGPPAPALVLTGGDPLKRPDLWELLALAAGRGFAVALAPSATALLTPGAIGRLREAGVGALSLSLDGADAASHDGLRGVPGCFARTLAAARTAAAVGLEVQINTLVSAETAPQLPAIASRVAALGAGRWSLFFLVPVGRGQLLQPLDPARAEAVLEWLAALAEGSPFAVSTTEAPHYRRVVLQRRRAAGWQRPLGALRRPFGIRDGNGLLFVSHTGDVQPSGFLPLSAGNVRTASPVELYRTAPLFRALRDPATFRGRCGRCEYRTVCGGSRARAYATSGDPLGEDPLCPYQPAATGAGGPDSTPDSGRDTPWSWTPC